MQKKQMQEVSKEINILDPGSFIDTHICNGATWVVQGSAAPGKCAGGTSANSNSSGEKKLSRLFTAADNYGEDMSAKGHEPMEKHTSGTISEDIRKNLNADQRGKVSSAFAKAVNSGNNVGG